MRPTDRTTARRFGWLVGAVGCAIASWPVIHGGPIRWPLALAGCLLIGGGTFWPAALIPLARAWVAVGTVIGKINTLVILAGIYYILCTPIGWCLRRRKTWAARFAFRGGRVSDWVPCVPIDPRDDMRRIF